jgi:hypothetical protein
MFEVGWRARKYAATESASRVLILGINETHVDLLVKLADDLGGRDESVGD